MDKTKRSYYTCCNHTPFTKNRAILNTGVGIEFGDLIRLPFTVKSEGVGRSISFAIFKFGFSRDYDIVMFSFIFVILLQVCLNSRWQCHGGATTFGNGRERERAIVMTSNFANRTIFLGRKVRRLSRRNFISQRKNGPSISSVLLMVLPTHRSHCPRLSCMTSCNIIF